MEATLVTVNAANTCDDTVNASVLPVTYLYRVIATASGSADSPPSPIDYATTATILFTEPIGSNERDADPRYSHSGVAPRY